MEDFLQERKDREAFHGQLEAFREKSEVEIHTLQLELRKKLVEIEQLHEDYQVSQSQIIAYKKQLDASKKELEEERRRGQVMQDRINALSVLQEQNTKLKAKVHVH